MKSYRYFALVSTVEGMPKALIEAMASGCICIGSPIDAMRELIDDGVNGILASGTSVEDIEEALIIAMRQPMKIGAAAHEFIKQKHSLDQYIRDEISVYLSIIG